MGYIYWGFWFKNKSHKTWYSNLPWRHEHERISLTDFSHGFLGILCIALSRNKCLPDSPSKTCHHPVPACLSQLTSYPLTRPFLPARWDVSKVCEVTMLTQVWYLPTSPSRLRSLFSPMPIQTHLKHLLCQLKIQSSFPLKTFVTAPTPTW